jgi:hypothetical protein
MGDPIITAIGLLLASMGVTMKPAKSNLEHKYAVEAQPARIGSTFQIYPNCIAARLPYFFPLKSPRHGKLEIKSRLVYPGYPKTNPLSACNTTPTPGFSVIYTPEPEFTGEDELVYLVVFGSGNSNRFVVKISVLASIDGHSK